MNWKTWAPLVLAVVLGLVAMKVARDVIARNNAGDAATGETTIVVTKIDLPPGSSLTSADLATTKIAGNFNGVSIFNNPADLEGRVLAVSATKGAPIIENMLAPKGAGSGMQALIPDGMRAITLEVNEFSGVAGNLTPGCRVDIVTTINGEAGEVLSRIVVQNIKVQALGTRAQAEQGAPTKSVTLLATPQEAEAIELAAATGRPRLVLRGATDNDTAISAGVTVAELRQHGGRGGIDPFGEETGAQIVSAIAPTSQPTELTQTIQPAPQRVVERPRIRQRQIKVIRGGVESEVTFEEIVAPISKKWMTNLETETLPQDDAQ